MYEVGQLTTRCDAQLESVLVWLLEWDIGAVEPDTQNQITLVIYFSIDYIPLAAHPGSFGILEKSWF